MDSINNQSINIDGVKLNSLKEIFDPKGSVLHFIRNEQEESFIFGECYFSEIQHNAIKAWKCHTKQTQNLTVPVGLIQIVLYDDRNHSSTYKNLENLFIGRQNHYYRITIPPGVVYGFKGLYPEKSLLVNFVDLPHYPNESKKMSQYSPLIPYILK